jgi:hypothetical protein
MPYPAAVYKVFIASPREVAPEHAVARRVMIEWNDLHAEHEGAVARLVAWETHSFPTSGRHLQGHFDSQGVEDPSVVWAPD